MSPQRPQLLSTVSSTTHVPHTYHARTTHVPHTYHTRTTHVPHTYHTCTTHVPHTYHTRTTHVPHTCSEAIQKPSVSLLINSALEPAGGPVAPRALTTHTGAAPGPAVAAGAKTNKSRVKIYITDGRTEKLEAGCQVRSGKNTVL